MSQTVFHRFDIAPRRLESVHGAYAVVAGAAMMVAHVPTWNDSIAIAMVNETLAIANHRHPLASITHFTMDAPSSSARRAIQRVMDDGKVPQPKRIVTLTDSVLVRAAAKAYSWLVGSSILPLAPHEYELAIRHSLAEETDEVHRRATQTFLYLYELVEATMDDKRTAKDAS